MSFYISSWWGNHSTSSEGQPAYVEFVTYEKGKPVIYAELSKAPYGTLQAALLFWQDLTHFLTENLSFTVNLYDWCVVNKDINGHHYTIS